MIIGFSRHFGKGGSRPVLNYLSGYLINGEARDPKPEVVRGDPTAVAEIIDSLPFAKKYSSGVLSFAPEDHVTPQIQEDVINRFEKAVFAGLASNRFAILWVQHTDKVRHELHFLIARLDLSTGRAFNPAPPTPASRELFDTLRDSINLRYDFADPTDPSRRQAISLPNHISKLVAQAKRHGRSAKKDLRETITEQLQGQAKAGSINSRADVVNFLKTQRYTITREGKDYLTIQRAESGERIRLKGTLFREDFCRNSQESLPPRRSQARLAAIEQRLERLVAARARYHRARYSVENEPQIEPIPQEPAHDAARKPFARNRSTDGTEPPGTGTTICHDPYGLGQATERLRNATHGLECAGQRFGRAHRAFTRDFSKTMTDLDRTRRSQALLRRYGVVSHGCSPQREAELELEL
jgi:hypothetical protein